MSQFAPFAHWLIKRDAKKIIPTSVDIDLTNVCNQDCFYCNSAEFRQRVPVQKKYTEYIDLIDKLSTWRHHSPDSHGDLHTVTFPGGGEPTVLPSYEKVIEHTVDCGFLTSLTTNGSKLDRLIENVHVNKIKKMGWIGIDLDAGSQELYEQIRHSLTRESLFQRVVDNATELAAMGANVDIKILLNQFNDNHAAIKDIFMLVKKINARMIYFRPAVINGALWQVSDDTRLQIKHMSEQTGVAYKLNDAKSLPRIYKKCHQMFLFPVFCADGKIYTCCENKGNPLFAIGSWDQNDFRDIWMGQAHMDVYEKTRVEFCQPCRPNLHNNRIQEILDDPRKLESLYL